MTKRIRVHFVATGQEGRASLARKVFAAVHHAVVYGDAAESLACHPCDGVVADSGQCAKLVAVLGIAGLWLPLI